MRLTLVIGGARSGKSRYALDEARRLGGDDVTCVMTAVVPSGDEEMARRIALHRAGRPQMWETIEEPRDVRRAISSALHSVILLDCLTILLSNHMADSEGEAEAEGRGRRLVSELVTAARARSGELIVVSNEVGQGIVPPYPLGRWFRDVQGRANQDVAGAADAVYLLVAGIPVALKGAQKGAQEAFPAS